MASNAVTSINSDSLLDGLNPPDLTPMIGAPRAHCIEFSKAVAETIKHQGDGRHVS